MFSNLDQWAIISGSGFQKFKKSCLLTAITLSLPLQALAQSGLRLATPEELRGIPLAAMPYAGYQLPPQVDLSPDMPPPGTQGDQNSCVGWATAYVLKSYQEKLEANYALSIQGKPILSRVFSPAFVYNQINNGRDGGGSYIDALNLLSAVGAVPWQAMPYRESDYRKRPNQALLAKARPYRIAYWRQVNIQDPTELKAHLHAGYPILIGALIDEGFFQAKTGHVWKAPQGNARGGHAMVLVGYDDHKQAFKLINSWGKEWADGGFGWIDYSYFRKVVHEGFVAKDALSLSLQPQEKNKTPNLELAKKPEQLAEAEKNLAPSTEGKPESQDKDARATVAPPVPVNEERLSSPNSPAPQVSLADWQLVGQELYFQGLFNVSDHSALQAQVVLRFYYDREGEPSSSLRSRAKEVYLVHHRDLATASQTISLDAPTAQLAWRAKLPLSAIQWEPQFQQGTSRYKVWVVPTLFLDNFGVAEGRPSLLYLSP